MRCLYDISANVQSDDSPVWRKVRRLGNKSADWEIINGNFGKQLRMVTNGYTSLVGMGNPTAYGSGQMAMGPWWTKRICFTCLLLTITVSKGGEVAEGAENPLIMASVEINACERESNECWQNDGPHPVRLSLVLN